MEAAPIFIRIEQHKDLAKLLAAAQQKLKQATTLLNQLERLKAEEDAQLAAWSDALAEVQARSDELKQALFTDM